MVGRALGGIGPQKGFLGVCMCLALVTPFLRDSNEPLSPAGASSEAEPTTSSSGVLQNGADEEPNVIENQGPLGISATKAQVVDQAVRSMQDNRQLFIGEFSDPDVVEDDYYSAVVSIGANLDPDTDLRSPTSSEPISIGQFSDPEEDGQGVAGSVQISLGDFKDPDGEA